MAKLLDGGAFPCIFLTNHRGTESAERERDEERRREKKR
jgi:hypothetical protein